MLNLGVEGMMLLGAVMGFLAVQRRRRAAGARAPCRSRRRGARRGCAALLLAFLVITLPRDQIVSGLAMTILAGAAGLSSYLGNDLGPRGRPGAAPARRGSTSSASPTCRSSARSCSARTAHLRLVGLRRRRQLVPVPHPAGPEPAGGRRVSGHRRRDGHQRHTATATSTRWWAGRSPGSAAPSSRCAITRTGPTA